eukprot:1182846-Prorocentrum_minimum.AAC.3
MNYCFVRMFVRRHYRRRGFVRLIRGGRREEGGAEGGEEVLRLPGLHRLLQPDAVVRLAAGAELLASQGLERAVQRLARLYGDIRGSYITSFYGSSCANNGEGARNTPRRPAVRGCVFTRTKRERLGGTVRRTEY